ncbi:MAG TPA: SusC/RagA family TonB-linked outer membrane protein, partial [Sphingobacteriaceae bacterium]
MKLTFVLMIVGLLQVSASGYAQKVTWSKTNVSLEELFWEINKQTGYEFFYDAKILAEIPTISVKAKNVTITTLLDRCFQSIPLSYTLENNIVVVRKDDEKLARLRRIIVTGKVTDNKGESLPGVSVKLKGTSVTAITNSTGDYSINLPDGNGTLVFSYIGFATQEVLVNGRANINIELVEELSALSEVVVVGYGTQRKADLTGAVSTVDAKVFQNRPLTNSYAALQGASSGVTVTRTSGQPGQEGYLVQIRGLSSVNGDTRGGALILIDGVPGSFSRLNPNDIESVSILKDAAAAAIYGAQAAQGVVLVTTKKGNGKTRVEYSGLFNAQRPIGVPERFNSWEEGEMLNKALVAAGQAPAFSPRQLEWMKDPYTNYLIRPSDPAYYEWWDNFNMVDAVVKDYSPSQNHNLAIHGGSKNDNYFISFGYFNQDGMTKIGDVDKANRINTRINYTKMLSSKFNFNANLFYTKSKTFSPAQSWDGDNALLYGLYTLRSIYPPTIPGTTDHFTFATGIYENLASGNSNELRSDNIGGVISFEGNNLVKGLKLTAKYSPQLLASRREIILKTLPVYAVDPTRILGYVNPSNKLQKISANNLTNNVQLLGDYDFKINNHSFHVLGGYQYQDDNDYDVNATANGLSSNEIFALRLGDPARASISDDVQSWALESYFGQMDYNFNDRFLFKASLRYDGSSRLAPGNRWKAFPSVSGAWRINNEKWFKNVVPYFDDVKLRVSYGQLGLQNGLGNYDYIALMQSGANYPFNNTVNRSYFIGTLASKQRSWETLATSNVGLDIALLKNRLNLTGDYFIKRNKNMFAPLQVSSIIGVSLPRYNVAELKSWGWEVNLGWRDAIGQKINYWVNANLSDYDNKIVKYSGQNAVGAGLRAIAEGAPFNSIWGFQADGYFDTAEELASAAKFNSLTGIGDIKYRDIDGNGKIDVGSGRLDDHGDLVYLGNTSPRYNYGFDLGMNVKGFDFSVFFQGIGKRKLLLLPQAVVPYA